MRISGWSLGALLIGASLFDGAVRAEPPAGTVAPISGGPIFISPMGEPFHGRDGLSGAEIWFRAADANHDDKITPDEFQADAMRFFKTLDTDHDHMIGPDEITRYETEIAPEIQVTSTYGDPSLAKQDSDGNVTDPPYPTRLGAGRYGFLDSPEPVVAADTNMDRAVTEQEFAASAMRRFKALDANEDGVLTRDELPKLSRGTGKNGKRRGGGGMSAPGGMDGGMGGMGGMGHGGMGGAGGMGGMGSSGFGG